MLRKIAISAPDALDPALQPEASVFVAANAGAGKTKLLTNRALSLLLQGVAPSHVLCLTYTKAAAAEMLHRVLHELGEWVMADEETLSVRLAALLGHAPEAHQLKRARGLFAGVLESPEGVRIQTLHGFCQSLLARFPLEAGISPHFELLEEAAAQGLLEEARIRLFTVAQQGDPMLRAAMDALARTLAEKTLNELFTEIIKNKRAFSEFFEQTFNAGMIRRRIRRACGLGMEDTLETLVERYFDGEQSAPNLLRQACEALLEYEQRTEKTVALAHALDEWLASPGTRAEQWERYSGVFLTKDRQPLQKLFPKAALEDSNLVNALLAEQARVWRLDDALASIALAEHTEQALLAAQAFLDIYADLKRQQARMDYDDLILKTCALLERSGMAQWVLYKLDGGIDHILVDEAQDTSPQQWRIVQALTQEFFSGRGRKEVARSLFVVGDEKQSIYSFQGADVAQLARMQRYFIQYIGDAQQAVHRKVLERSFRSTQEVLAVVDAVFAQPQARSGLLSEDVPIVHVLTRTGQPGLVELWPLLAGKDVRVSALRTQMAQKLAGMIAGWLEQGLWLPAKGRQAQPGDIMILVRTRSTLVEQLVRALKRRGVPVSGIDRMKLEENLAVQDLIALGQTLLLPEDDLTLAAVLKSPIFNISEETLFALAWDRGGASLWDRLETRPDCAGAAALLRELRALEGAVPPYELYVHLLDTRGARRHITGRMGEEYNDAIDEFLNLLLLYERGNTPSLQGFLHWLSRSQTEIKRDMEQSRSQVRVMTVHAAKGLQAPIVILPDTTDLPQSRGWWFWLEEEGQGALPLCPPSAKRQNALCVRLREAKRHAEHSEYRRALYVALTRAEDQLYIFGAAKEEERSGSWYELIHQGIQTIAHEPFETPQGKGLRVGQVPVYVPHEAVPDVDLPPIAPFEFLSRPPADEPVPSQPLAPSRLSEEAPPAASPLMAQGVHRRGELTHSLLQHLPAMPPEAREPAASAWLAGVAPEMPEAAREQCVQEVLAVLRDPACAFLFGPGSMAEVPVAGTIMVKHNPVTVSGQIDRLYIGARDVWIADFKSNRIPPSRLEDIPGAYMRQMALYRALLAGIYPGHALHCALVWTAGPAITLLDEALLSTYIQV